MTKHKLLTIFISMLIVGCMIAIIPAIVEHDKKNLEEFKILAKENLGTDDFELWLMDDQLIAKTSDGRQYPSEEKMVQYSTNYLLTVSGICVGAFLLFMALSLYFRRGKGNELETAHS